METSLVNLNREPLKPGYNIKKNKGEPLILEPEDWTKEEYLTLCKVFGCPIGTERIKVTYSTVEFHLGNKNIEEEECYF